MSTYTNERDAELYAIGLGVEVSTVKSSERGGDKIVCKKGSYKAVIRNAARHSWTITFAFNDAVIGSTYASTKADAIKVAATKLGDEQYLLKRAADKLEELEEEEREASDKLDSIREQMNQVSALLRTAKVEG